MPSAPWLVPLLTAFLAGGLAGFSITLAVVSIIRHSRTVAHGHRAESVRWLAARIVLSRATISLVAAMRALKSGDDSASFPQLRVAEAQRARSAWFAARRELDRASAALEGWYASQGVRRIFVTDDFGDGALRRAIEGDDSEAAKLLQSLREADMAARTCVQDALKPHALKLRPAVRGALSRVAAPFFKVLRAWSEKK